MVRSILAPPTRVQLDRSVRRKVDNRIFFFALRLCDWSLQSEPRPPRPRPRGFCPMIDVVLEAVWAELDGTTRSVVSCGG